jgi:hypothetical protein
LREMAHSGSPSQTQANALIRHAVASLRLRVLPRTY